MKIILLTTTVWSSESARLLQRLTTSIGQTCNRHLDVRHVMLLQNWTQNELPELSPAANHQLEFITTEEMISLSEARNRMLTFSNHKQLIDKDDILAFPDDDCWYPENALAQIALAFEKNTQLDFFFCKYKNDGHIAVEEISTQKQASATDVVRNASSNTVFLRGSLALLIGGFDRGLGVGAANNGGEDLDYGLKAYLNAQHASYSPLSIVGHRDKDHSLRGKYFRGSALALRRYFYKRGGLVYEYGRKMLIGVVLIWRGEMPAKELIIAAKGAAPDSDLSSSP